MAEVSIIHWNAKLSNNVPIKWKVRLEANIARRLISYGNFINPIKEKRSVEGGEGGEEGEGGEGREGDEVGELYDYSVKVKYMHKRLTINYCMFTRKVVDVSKHSKMFSY